MRLDARTATVELPRIAASQRPRYRDRFFVGVAVAAAMSVFLGFARTYYLKTLFPTPPFPLLFHIHGVLFTGWMLLVVLQVSLVASKKTRLHRRVGWIGVSLVLPMLVTGSLVAIAAARGNGPISAAVRRGELTWVPVAIGPMQMLLNNLATMVLFGVFAIAGIAVRRRPDAHKRLMLLATIGLLPAAIGRAAITILGVFHPGLLLGSAAFFVVVIAIYDRRSRGRVHPVTLWAGSALVLSFPARLALAKTDLWQMFAAWLIH
jgi:hypothetical protein